MLGDAYHALGRTDDCVDAYRQARARFRDIGQRHGEATCLRKLGTALNDSGSSDAAMDCWREALALLDELNHPDAETLRPHVVQTLKHVAAQHESAFERMFTLSCGAFRLFVGHHGVMDVDARHAELTETVREQERIVRAALAVQAQALAEIHHLGTYARDGARSMRVWLREALNLSEREAKTRVLVADATAERVALSGAALEPEHPATTEAVSSGEITFDHARTIVEGVAALPSVATDSQRDDAERMLAEQARILSPRQVGVLAERVRYLLDQDGALRTEEAQHGNRELHFGVGRDGMTVLKGRLDREAGAKLRAVLEPLAAPRPEADGTKDPRSAGQRNADALVDALDRLLASDQLPRTGGARPRIVVTIDYRDLAAALGVSTATTAPTSSGVPLAGSRKSDPSDAAEPGGKPERAETKLADVPLASPRESDTTSTEPNRKTEHARNTPTAVPHTSPRQLHTTNTTQPSSKPERTQKSFSSVRPSDVEAARIPVQRRESAPNNERNRLGRGMGTLTTTGQPISAATVRRMACDASILPVVLGGDSVPLDVGRARRTAPPHLRAALLARDGQCGFPGCDQPPGTSECHHLVTWVDGGHTSLDNMVMLCAHHHRTVHQHQWHITVENGRPIFTPPPWVDPQQAPRPGGRPPHQPQLIPL